MINLDDMYNKILNAFDKAEFVNIDDFPNIELYMDQLTSFMDKNLSNMTRNGGDEKILTKTMINNYAKNNLLPPPDKKKYTKEHMLILMFIYYFKNVLSIKDIQTILNPLTDKYFNNSNLSFSDIFSEITKKQDDELKQISNDIKEKMDMSKDMFKDVKGKSQNELQTFAFITMMTLDIYARKLVVQKLIDEIDGGSSNE